MVKRNYHFSKLKDGFLFPEITRRKEEYLAKYPNAKLINLGIGDTTQPLTPHVLKGLLSSVNALGTKEGYTGYGCEYGMLELRAKLASQYYKDLVKSSEILVSDGSLCDIGRLQSLFGSQVSIAIQDPGYPAFFDGSVIRGIENIINIPCLPENDFFPDLAAFPRTDLVYLCSPNNPTGTALSKDQLESIVNIAKKNRSIIIYDASYAQFIQEPNIPKSIYEIEGAREIAIELGSFSKSVGFTGVRLGWSVVPEELKFDDGSSVLQDWKRLVVTTFNGASIISQYGGLAALEKEGLKEACKLVEYYLDNTHLLKKIFKELGYEVYGGENAPYIWVRFSKRKSWEVFQELLENQQIITIPGSGFGPSGESFIRFSLFCAQEKVFQISERFLDSKSRIK